ncbi:cupin domain-containing protein [Pleurocapsales cyanobacterium LEGE 06147]|nr:cupin domain-containing protein [Pleurocapsales cyanobacterium LEGE 06147]
MTNRSSSLVPSPISAKSIPATMGKTIYPEPYAALVKGRLKRKLGEYFGLTNFGVNLTHLNPGAISALAHNHSKQDEFILILEGTPTLVLGKEEFVLHPGDCYGFKAGTGIAHQLVNRSEGNVTYLEIGDRAVPRLRRDRTQGDEVEYLNDDLIARQKLIASREIYRTSFGGDNAFIFIVF